MEILVAIAIFAILAGMAYRALTAVLETRARIEAENRKWRTIAFAIIRMEQDLDGAINRQIRDIGGTLQPAFVGNPTPLPGDGELMFTRAGELDADGYETAPIRVGYTVANGVLEQLSWPVLDRAIRTQPTVTPLLAGVDRLEFAYASATGLTTPVWPQTGNSPNPLPAAVAVRITFANGEQMTRVFALREPVTQ